MPGPLPVRPEKQPQNIHPDFLWILSTIHVGSNSSPFFLVTYVFVWRPPVIQVSSVQSILHHCSHVHVTCLIAQANRKTRFFSEIGGLTRPTRRLYPSFSKACWIEYSLIFGQSRIAATWLYGIRRVAREVDIKCITAWTWS